ncbi:GTP-binding protein [Flavobacterium branchiophilum]|uniref:Uncharacterized protein DUF2452 n=1 Tax=Flavobacterium branchiophilum TaxID=55197 RepID=A0A543G6R4_9FLAO|nr:DUF2452 domain-containing protein [Flavobacterium branchiophilum]OXA70414.1 GTP-binding protein [Flavobacterium branchiophilum] [Flavobacterium branchiophilum NBRC 15030 = ATCC 35035]TQM41776.1 uncharacterized protein DUF2452 [Flavobacterium branchiophilum]GEM56227.1 GTP-binding protein [Flavobacterium branchiophilum NBRC 15030 = ATCC 35035]
MNKKLPDQVVYDAVLGYHANRLSYPTQVGAPVIQIDDVAAWKTRGVRQVNKEFEQKFSELKLQFEKLMMEFEWNEVIYKSKFSFEPVIGEIYHLYENKHGEHFLSLIGPKDWNKEHVGSFQLNSEKKWIKID